MVPTVQTFLTSHCQNHYDVSIVQADQGQLTWALFQLSVSNI